MIVSRPLLIICFVVALAMLASAQQQPGQKKKGARAKTKSFRLRRHPHLSRSHSRSLATTSVEDEEEAWGSEVSDARELNIFLRNAASLIFDDNIVMSMSMPTTAPAVVRPALGGITGNSEDTSAPASTLSPTISGAVKDNSSAAETPQALSEGPIEPNSTGGARLPIIGAVFLVAGTVFLGAILANRWKEKKSGDDLLRMQKLESCDSNTNTNDVTATDIPYPSPDSTILGFSTDDDQGDDGEDVEENNSIDTGAAAIRSIDVESFPKYNGDSVGDLSSVDFEAADGSGNVVSVLSGLTPQNAIENKPRSVSPYCYPSFQIWPKDEDSTM